MHTMDDLTRALLPDQLNLAPRDVTTLLAEAAARRDVRHPEHGGALDATESALVRHAFLEIANVHGLGGGITALQRHHRDWAHGAFTILSTTDRAPITLGFDRLVVGDDGAWLELTDAHWITMPTPATVPRSHDPLLGLAGADPYWADRALGLLCYRQHTAARLAPRRAGAWYLDPCAVRLDAALVG